MELLYKIQAVSPVPQQQRYKYMLAPDNQWLFVSFPATETDIKAKRECILKRIEEWHCDDGKLYHVYRVTLTRDQMCDLLEGKSPTRPDLYIVENVDKVTGICSLAATLKPSRVGIYACSNSHKTPIMDPFRNKKFADLRPLLLSVIVGKPSLLVITNVVQREEVIEKDYHHSE